ncbi:MAG: hypothetical protein HWE27_10585 [Gammaproteobacteria bacterium]|nr:hypothetical protein [Gammaproteobacteria bacterium]
MKSRLIILFLSGLGLILSSNSSAEGWCDFSVGDYQIITHGNKSDQVYIMGKVQGTAGNKWYTIANASAGKHNISLVLAAQIAGKGISIYIDSADYDCNTYPSWSTSPIRHVKINM